MLPYYLNSSTSESQWEPPREANQEILRKYMAKNHSTTVVSRLRRVRGKIRCAHLLVKHNESKRPSSWKEASLSRIGLGGRVQC